MGRTLSVLLLFLSFGAWALETGFYKECEGDKCSYLFLGKKLRYDRSTLDIVEESIVVGREGQFKKLTSFSDFSFFTTQLSMTTFISHRGLCNDKIFPCNTLGAFEAALLSGYNGIELDVQVTADNHFVVTHDEKLRTTTHCKGKVKEYRLDELEACEVYRSNKIPELKIFGKKAKFAAHLVSLKTAFELFLPRENVQKLVIDIKPDSNENLLEAMQDALTGFPQNQIRKLIVISRSLEFLKTIKSLYPELSTALEGSTGTEPYKHTAKFLERAKGNYDVVSLSAGIELGRESYIFSGSLFWKSLFVKGTREKLLQNYITEVRKMSDPVETIAWTVNGKRMLKVLDEAGFEYVMSDRPFYEIAPLVIENEMKRE